jgi:hypothetical protein
MREVSLDNRNVSITNNRRKRKINTCQEVRKCNTFPTVRYGWPVSSIAYSAALLSIGKKSTTKDTFKIKSIKKRDLLWNISFNSFSFRGQEEEGRT